MRNILTMCGWLVMVPVLFAAPPITDPATLFPADSLFYAEVREPAKLSPELQRLIKGSILEDHLDHVDQLRDNNSEYVFPGNLVGWFAETVSSEFINELQRFHGMSLGITGFNARHQPELACVLLTGESVLPRLIMRMYLTSPSVRKIAQVGDVRIYQEFPDSEAFLESKELLAAQPKQAKPAPLTATATYAVLPGLIILGSSVESVSAIVKRWEQRDAKSSYADNPALAAMRSDSKQGGIYWALDYPRFAAAIDAMYPKGKRELEPVEWEVSRRLLPPALITQLVGCATLQDGDFDLVCRFRVNERQRSPLLRLLGNGAMPAPNAQEAKLLLQFGLSKEKRQEHLFQVVDAITQTTGGLGALPGERIRESKEAPAISSAIDRIESVRMRIDAAGAYLIELQFDADTATIVEAKLPEWLSSMLGEKIQPTNELLGDVKIHRYVGSELSGGLPFYVARQQGTLCLGLNAKSIATSMEKRNVPIPEAGDPASVLNGQWHWGKAMIPWLDTPDDNQDAKLLNKIERQLASLLEKQPIAEFSLTQREQQYTLRLRQPQLHRVMPKLIDRVHEQWRLSHELGEEQMLR